MNSSAERWYRTMTTEELCALPVTSLAADDCVLLMWATWPTLPDAMRVVEAWGFNYITGFPWVKLDERPIVDLFGETHMYPFYGIGFWIRGCSEPILIARRGHPRMPDFDYLGLISKRMKHSRKPDNIHHYAESLQGPYLELFARRPRPGWDLFGNEVSDSITLEVNDE